jgi:hypothetical protein
VNLDAVSGGLDVAAAPKLQLPDLSGVDPEKVEASVKAYQAALNAISQPLNTGGVSAPGGAVRIAHASQRSVTMTQTFDRPLVIGYRGFDVQVFKDGTLSAPIPSFSVVSGVLGKDPLKAYEASRLRGRTLGVSRASKKAAIMSSVATNKILDKEKWQALVDRSNLPDSTKVQLKNLKDFNAVNTRLDLDAGATGRIVTALHDAL